MDVEWNEFTRIFAQFRRRCIKCIADFFFVHGLGSVCFNFRHINTLLVISEFFTDEIPFLFRCFTLLRKINIWIGIFWTRRIHRSFEKICNDCTNDVFLLLIFWVPWMSVVYHFFLLFFFEESQICIGACWLTIHWKISFNFVNNSSQFSCWYIGFQSAKTKSLLNFSPKKNFLFLLKRYQSSFLPIVFVVVNLSGRQTNLSIYNLIFCQEAVIDKRLISFADASGSVQVCWVKCQTRCKVIK